ncbi:MAG: single-stranded DNA-binding protein [Chloroflexia bacterium]|nr:single-stranded DNA-binding protein [Chloroflexia bacterium]MDQ3514825.1 single-stranded DNA-binding protein [Chloroflexota bacterium]
MAGISKVILIGNLGRDPETRYTPSGVMNVQFSIAVSRRYTDSSGQQQEQTSWFRITGWGKLAETMDGLTQRGWLTKGKQVYVEGRLEAREYQDQAGQTRTSLDVNATELQLLGQRGDSEGGFGGGASGSGGGSRGRSGDDNGGQGDGPSDMDDVPF